MTNHKQIDLMHRLIDVQGERRLNWIDPTQPTDPELEMEHLREIAEIREKITGQPVRKMKPARPGVVRRFMKFVARSNRKARN